MGGYGDEKRMKNEVNGYELEKKNKKKVRNFVLKKGGELWQRKKKKCWIIERNARKMVGRVGWWSKVI